MLVWKNYLIRNFWNQFHTKSENRIIEINIQNMKSIIICIMLFVLSVNVLAQENQLEQSFQKGEELFEKGEYKKAYPLLKEAANLGHSRAQFLIGKMYMLGWGLSFDYTEALNWYKKSANAGYALAYNNIGVMYSRGWGVPKDVSEAKKWYLKAADQGIAIAQTNIGSLYLAGEGVEKNCSEAIKWYTKAADQGHAPALTILGNLYDKGECVEKNSEIAFSYYQKAAELGNATGMANLGICYKEGKGTKQDSQKAFELISKAANMSELKAQCELGRMYQTGEGAKQDFRKAHEWYQKAAEQGYPPAQLMLGIMYEGGKGVKQNYAKAVDWYQKAAEQNYIYAITCLAVMYTYGKGVKQDYAEAAWLFRKSAEMGDSRAQTSLGILYEEGKGVIQNEEEAAKWFLKALEIDPSDKDAQEGLKRTRPSTAIQNKPSTSSSTSTEIAKEDDSKVSIDASGTGFVIDKRGYLATNYHVTEGARGIYVCLQKDGVWKSYNAILIKEDPTNDLSIIKIDDDEFVQFTSLPYNFTTEVEDVAADIYTLGYPRVNVMGTDIKYTAGAVNSKTGIQGDPTHYQISAHTDHGNSGGPMFNSKGAIIGITDSGLDKAKYGDVNYAIKSSYLKSLVDALPIKLELPHDASIEKLSRVEQIKVLSKYTSLILIDLR